MEGEQTDKSAVWSRGWASLRHIEIKRNENEYFGQITVAFLSSSLLYSTAEEGHFDLAEIFIFVSFQLYIVLVMLTRRPDDALVSLR